MEVVSDPSGFVFAFASGILWRFQPLGPIRLPLAVTKKSPISVSGGKPMARNVVWDRIGPEAGLNVAALDDAGFMLMVVRDAWLLSRGTRSLSGHWSVSGGGRLALVALKADREYLL